MASISPMLLPHLAQVRDPRSGSDIVSLGWVAHASLEDGTASIILETGTTPRDIAEQVRHAAEVAARAVPGVTQAFAVLTGERAAATPPEAPPAAPKTDGLSQVRHIVAVGSGKGGVGKSTVAANIAVALAQAGLAVGILDADIYGPSLPTLLGLTGKPDTRDKKLLPKSAHGVQAMSIGLLIDPDTAMIWRGPMATSALHQMLTDVLWGVLDVLILDLPPGTGDIQLSLAQRTKLSGAVIVSTPQDLALIDARKAITMFQKVNVPILGLVENMSHFICPSCGTQSDIFGHGGAQAMAGLQQMAYLGGVPLHLAVRQASDAGVPVVISAPDSAEAQAFAQIARQLVAKLQVAVPQQAPTLRMID